MRCASLHRKLGTHISKVKSLSMDTWSTEQVEAMKRNGNTTVNKTFNPKNVRPDMPLDADEVDSAMERFIRKKYQDRSLSSGKPTPPSHSDVGLIRSLDDSPPPPPLPPKKGKFFGFGLRATSSGYPLSKHDKKSLPAQPVFENTSRPSSDGQNHSSGKVEAGKKVPDADVAEKLITLREMGFLDDKRNLSVLRGLNGNLERTVESLVKLGHTQNPSSRDATLVESAIQAPSSSHLSDAATNASAAPSQISNNPFDQLSNTTSIGPSFGPPQQQRQPPVSNNGPDSQSPTLYSPYSAVYNQQTPAQTLEQSLQGMYISQPLFPNSTGGYPSHPQHYNDPRLQHSMTPPVQATPNQYGYAISPTTINGNSNPFFQSIESSQTMLNNPYAPVIQNAPPMTPSTNPFLNPPPLPTPNQQPSQQPSSSSNLSNPFGLPPSEPLLSPPQQIQQQTSSPQSQSIFDQNQYNFLSNGSGQQSAPPQTQHHLKFPPQQPQQYQQPYQISPMAFQNTTPSHIQVAQQSQIHSQQRPPTQANSQYPFQQPVLPQQTGRFDKSSILALYNYPHLAPQQPSLPSIPEPAEASATASPGPSNSPAAGVSNTSGKRSATMPISSTSPGFIGSRNPFFNNGGSGGVGSIAARHASQESVNIANLESGRHSPDAFANLSARYVR